MEEKLPKVEITSQGNVNKIVKSRYFYPVMLVLSLIVVTLVLLVYLLTSKSGSGHVFLANLFNYVGINVDILSTKVLSSNPDEVQVKSNIAPEFIQHGRLENGMYYYHLLGEVMEIPYYYPGYKNIKYIPIKTTAGQTLDVTFNKEVTAFYWAVQSVDNFPERFPEEEIYLSDDMGKRNIAYVIEDGEVYLKEGDFIDIMWVTILEPKEALLFNGKVSEKLIEEEMDEIVAAIKIDQVIK